jgi:hypothetical protein
MESVSGEGRTRSMGSERTWRSGVQMEGVQMSDYTIPTSNTVTTIDPQATKIRELQSDVNELNELVEYLQDRIRKLKKAGNGMYDFINPPSPCMRTSRMDNLLQGWDDAKININ